MSHSRSNHEVALLFPLFHQEFAKATNAKARNKVVTEIPVNKTLRNWSLLS